MSLFRKRERTDADVPPVADPEVPVPEVTADADRGRTRRVTIRGVTILPGEEEAVDLADHEYVVGAKRIEGYTVVLIAADPGRVFGVPADPPAQGAGSLAIPNGAPGESLCPSCGATMQLAVDMSRVQAGIGAPRPTYVCPNRDAHLGCTA